MPQLFSHWFLLLSLALFHVVGPVPPELGVHGGALAPCPSTAHCARADWPVADPQAALAALQPVLAAMPRTELLEQTAGYLHATASSALFGFVDDLELLADPQHGPLRSTTSVRGRPSTTGARAARAAAGSATAQSARAQWAGEGQAARRPSWAPSSGGTGPTRWNRARGSSRASWSRWITADGGAEGAQQQSGSIMPVGPGLRPTRLLLSHRQRRETAAVAGQFDQGVGAAVEACGAVVEREKGAQW